MNAEQPSRPAAKSTVGDGARDHGSGFRQAARHPATIVAGLCIVLTIALLWLLPDSVPLGVPGEWTWSRIPFSIETAFAWGASLFSLGVYLLVVWKGDESLAASRSRPRQLFWLSVLVVVGCAWWSHVLLNMPGIHGYGRAPFILYYARSSGYFLQAKEDAGNLRGFLSGYEELLSEEDYLHIGTHPPGLTSGYRVLLEACRRIGPLRDFLLWCEPQPMRDSMQEIRDQLVMRGGELTPADEACLAGAALFTQLVFVLGAVALFAFLRLDHSLQSAWRVAAGWPLIPGGLVFFPKSDLLLPTIALACAACWFYGLRGSRVLCAVSGLIAWMGMMLSLALAPVLVIMALATMWMRPWLRTNTSSAKQSLLRHLLVPIGWGLVGFVVPSLLLWLWSGLNVANVWSWNLHNHALFYEHNTRTWWAWLLVNPLEFAMTLGLPIAAFALFIRSREDRPQAPRTATGSLLVAWCLVMALLWLSGKNMGEAARLWLVFTPWPCLGLIRPLRPAASGEPQPDHSRWIWLALLVAQGVCCILTVTRVDGFHFDQLLAG